MHSFEEWLELHEITEDVLADVVLAYNAGALRVHPPFTRAAPSGEVAESLGPLDKALSDLIRPAFQDAFQNCGAIGEALARIRIREPAECETNHPCTINRGPGRVPVLVLQWTGKPTDLLTLAHEVAHAVQITLSRGAYMPPLAREVCAFLGELLLISHVKKHRNPRLLELLLGAWEDQNALYLGRDLDSLKAALQATKAPYHYRQNYPVARLLACALFMQGRGEWLTSLFASGEDAMAHLPVEKMASKAGTFANYLPALQRSDQDLPALGPYRSLGAMTLLETEYRKGVSEKPIGEVYQTWLGHMRDQTAFIALDLHDRPLGYATWIKPPSANKITLTRQAAPFGDHLELQSALNRHLQHETGRSSFNPSAGYALELLAQSPYHGKHQLGDYFRTEILPALWSGQCRFYVTEDGVPAAMVTWAWLSAEVEREVHASGRALSHEEWNCGDRLFFNDWITPYGNIREVAHDMTHNIFPDQTATSLRRNMDGSVRRVSRWTGAAIRQRRQVVA
ncbi:toxin-activating lysine-acyltransferase [Roseinatronobacter sp. S2]|uniref:toxin-activating lysine-acyltransferase n=1 Tax=Roseinatronobacter sp. S2 TaxID=3035471 RepID=UPI0024107DB2|nr:toxin-activating lysine-acyltransferase [Roseinatronobacter sp. S2]WFE75758.1 toxin-activating lysine-acyltransferase [Roseinatronobacter sp. S2]